MMGFSRLQTADLPMKPKEAHYKAATLEAQTAGASVALGSEFLLRPAKKEARHISHGLRVHVYWHLMQSPDHGQGGSQRCG